jgi:hypothetical protein
VLRVRREVPVPVRITVASVLAPHGALLRFHIGVVRTTAWWCGESQLSHPPPTLGWMHVSGPFFVRFGHMDGEEGFNLRLSMMIWRSC